MNVSVKLVQVVLIFLFIFTSGFAVFVNAEKNIVDDNLKDYFSDNKLLSKQNENKIKKYLTKDEIEFYKTVERLKKKIQV